MHEPPPRSPACPPPGSLWVLVVAALLSLGALVPRSAAAADQRPVVLPLASGKTIQGVVESADAKEVVVRVGTEEVRRVPWDQLVPLGVYRAKAALAPATDGKARLSLAQLAVELGLYAEARVEYEKAYALGAIDAKQFQAVVTKAESDAVRVGLAQALRAAEAGDCEGALERARQLKLHFGSAPNAAAIDHLIADLVKQVTRLQDEATEAAKELEKIQVEAERNKEILRRRTQAIADVETGRKEAEKAAAARGLRNVTRVRKYSKKADLAFTSARRNLGRLRRIVPRKSDTYRDILARLSDLDRLQFQFLLETARFFTDERTYDDADLYAAKASYIDPVNADLLELRDFLRTVRIHYRMSDITNAHPIVR